MRLLNILGSCLLVVLFSFGLNAMKMLAPTDGEASASDVKKACSCPVGAMCKCKPANEIANDDEGDGGSVDGNQVPQGKIKFVPGQAPVQMPEDNCQPGKACI